MQQCADNLFTAKSFYMFRVSQHPSSGAIKTVTATSGIGHTVKYKLKINYSELTLCWFVNCRSTVNKPTQC